MARALVRPRVRAALPPPHQRLGPAGARHRDPRVRDLAPGRPRRASNATSSRPSTGCPTSSTRSSACSTRSARCGRSAWSWSPRSWRGGGDSRATSPSAASSAWVLARLIGTLVVENASLMHALDVVTRVGDDTVAFPAVRVGGDRRGDLGGVAVPHPTGAPPRAAARAAHRDRVAVPRHHASRRRARRGRARLVGRGARAPRLRVARRSTDRRTGAGHAGRARRRRARRAPAAQAAGHRHRDERARRHRRPHGAGARPRRSRRAADVEVLAVPRVQGRRARAAHDPPGRRRGAGVHVAARGAGRGAGSRRRGRRHGRARRRADRIATAGRARRCAISTRRPSPTRCWSTSGSRSPRCTTRASRTGASTATTSSSTGPPSASATSSSPPAPPRPGAAPPTSPSCS